MARIIVVHGVSQQSKNMHARLFPVLREGVARFGVRLEPRDVVFQGCDYTWITLPMDTPDFEPYPVASDFGAEYEQALMLAWLARATDVDQYVLSEEKEALGRSPQWLKHALDALNRSRFFSGLTEMELIESLRQVRSYFRDPAARAAILKAVCQRVSSDTRVIVGHGLGSVVAYEALCAHHDWPVRTLVTLGSPLGLRHLVYDLLQPPPRRDGAVPCGVWPEPVTMWTNVTDSGDAAAVVEDLRPLFGNRICQIRVHNGVQAHDMRPYLAEPATATAVASGLDD